jgi:uncharacterized iron-regulated membrane protein
MTFRQLLFWIHLVAGAVAGSVIFIMCVTGTLLTFQQSVLRLVERDQRVVAPPSPDAPRLDLDTLLARVQAAMPDAAFTTVTLDSDRDAAASIATGQGPLFVDPYTGTVLGTGSPRARAFYRAVTSWHRWLAVEGEGRATARAVTGACNIAFLVLAITGLYLWIPRQWTWRHVAPVIWFRGGLRGKPRDFNWHNALGLWCAPVLIVLTATGMVISYPWASNLVYTLTGSPRPAAAGGRGGGPVRSGEAIPALPAPGISLSSLMAHAERQVPEWRTMIVRLPQRQGGPVAFSMSDRNHWNSYARSTLTLDGSSGAPIRWEPYADASRGQKVRGWMRFAHTGELGGIPGEAVAGLACAGGAVLVWTGIALALRRFAAWRSRSRGRATAALAATRT